MLKPTKNGGAVLTIKGLPKMRLKGKRDLPPVRDLKSLSITRYHNG